MALDPLNSVGGFSTGIPSNTIIQANGQITTSKGANITGNINLGNINSGTANINILGGGNGQILGVDANGNLLFQSRINNGTANFVILGNGNISVSAGNVANVGVFYGNSANGNSGLAIQNDLSLTGNLVANGDASIGGNLNVIGNTNFTSVNNLAIADPFINLAVNGAGGPLSNPDNFDRGTLFHFYGANRVTTANANIDITATPGNTVKVVSLGNVAVGQAVYGNTATGNALFPLTAVVANVDLANLQFSANANLVANVTVGDQVVFGSDLLSFTGYDRSTNTYVFAANVTVTNNVVTYADGNLMNLKAKTVTATLDGNIVRGASNVIVNTDGNINLNVPTANSINISGNANSEIKLTTGANGNVSLTGNANSNINITGGANSNFIANVTNIDFKTAGMANIALGYVSNLHIDGGSATAATLGAITLNGSGNITNIAIGDGGSGYDIAPTITVTGANTLAANISTTLTNGVVTAIVINNGGTGYASGTVAATISAPGIKYLKTDGTGNLAWREVNASGGSGGSGTPGGANTQVQFNDNGTFGANSNFTYNKTTRTLSVPNISANGSNIQFGNVGNVHITGGANRQFLKTDGTGNLNFANGTFQTYEYNTYTLVTVNSNPVQTVPTLNVGDTSAVISEDIYTYSSVGTVNTTFVAGATSILATGDLTSSLAVNDIIKVSQSAFGLTTVDGLSYDSMTNITTITVPAQTSGSNAGDTIYLQGTPLTPVGSKIAWGNNGQVLTVTGVGQFDPNTSFASITWAEALVASVAFNTALYSFTATMPVPIEYLALQGGIYSNVDVANSTLGLFVSAPDNIYNGTSNVTIPTANGNVNFNVNGNAIANVNANGIAAIGVNVGPFSANTTAINLGNIQNVYANGGNIGQALTIGPSGTLVPADSGLAVITGSVTGFANVQNAFATTSAYDFTTNVNRVNVSSPNTVAISTILPIGSRINFGSNVYYRITALGNPASNISNISIAPNLAANVSSGARVFKETIANVSQALSGNNISIQANTQTGIAQISATPSGTDTQLQYNANGVLSASANLTFDYTNNIFTTTTANITGNVTANNANITNNATVNATLTLPANSNLSFSGRNATFSNIGNVKAGGSQLPSQVVTTDGGTNLRFANATLWTNGPATYTPLSGNPTLAAPVSGGSSLVLNGDYQIYTATGDSVIENVLDPTSNVYAAYYDETVLYYPSAIIRFGSNTGNAALVSSSQFIPVTTPAIASDAFTGEMILFILDFTAITIGIEVQCPSIPDAIPAGTGVTAIDPIAQTVTLTSALTNDIPLGTPLTFITSLTVITVDPSTPVNEAPGTSIFVNSGSLNGVIPFSPAQVALSLVGGPFTVGTFVMYNVPNNTSAFSTYPSSIPGSYAAGTQLYSYAPPSAARYEKIVAGTGITLSTGGNPSTLTINANVSATPSYIANGTSNVNTYNNANVTISSAGQSNIFDISSNGTHAQTTIQDDVTVTGNLNVSGNTNFINVNELAVTNPLIQLGIAGNNSPLVTNDGKDRGLVSHIFGANLVTTSSGSTPSGNTVIKLASVTGVANGQAVFANDVSNVAIFPADAVVSNVDVANTQITVSNASVLTMPTGTQVVIGSDKLEFMGWKAANAEFQTRANVTQNNQIIAGGAYANIRSNYFKGNVYNDTANLTLGASGTVNVLNISATQVTANGTFVVNGDTYLQGQAQLGSNSTVHITGGANAEYLQTDGTGNLRWTEGTLHTTDAESWSTTGLTTSDPTTIGSQVTDVVGDALNYQQWFVNGNPVTLTASTVIGADNYFISNLGNTQNWPGIGIGGRPVTLKLGVNGFGCYAQLNTFYPGNLVANMYLTLDQFTSVIPAGTNVYIDTGSTSLAIGNLISFGQVSDGYTIEAVGPAYSNAGVTQYTSFRVTSSFTNVYAAGTTVYNFTPRQYFTQIAAGNGISANVINGNTLVIDSNATPNSIFSGNSNVFVNANSNVTVSVAGNANVVTFTGNGAVAGVGKTLTLQSSNGTANHSVTIKTSTASAFNANYTLTLPVSDGNAGQILATDGTGVLSWADGTSLSNGSSNINIDFDDAIRFSSNGLANVLSLSNNNANFSAPIVNVDSQGYTSWTARDVTANYDRGLFLGQTLTTGVTAGNAIGNSIITVTSAVGINIGDKVFVQAHPDQLYTVVNVATNNIELVPVITSFAITTSDFIQTLNNFAGWKGNASEFQFAQQANVSNNKVSVYSYANVRANVFKGAIAANTITANNTVTLSNAVNITGNLNFTGANATFSNVSNLHIPGGGSNYFLATDGAGHLSWTYVTPTSASIPNVHFNVSVAGNNQQFANTILEAYPANTDMVVFRNGALLTADNYLLNNPGGLLTINIPLLVNDNIDIIRQGVVTISNSILTSNYAAIPTVEFIAVANGNNQTFSNTYLRYYSSNLDLNLFVNGAIQQDNTYTLNPATGVLTFNLPLQVGDSIIIPNKLANVSNLANGLAGSNTQVLYNDQDTVNASAAFTFNNSSNTVSVVNLVANGTANLGDVANVRILGGTNGFFLRTDGTGNLSFADVIESNIVNGNSNVNVLANANVTVSSNGQANIIVVSSTSTAATTTIANTLVVTGNVQANNVQASNNIVANGNITANNANVGNLNVVLDAVVNGNLTVIGGFNISSVSNGNSNIKVYANSDVEISANGKANILSVYANGNVGVLTNSGSNPAYFTNTGGLAVLSGPNSSNAAVRFASSSMFIGSGNASTNMLVTYDDYWRLNNTSDATDNTGATGAFGIKGGISVAKSIYAGLGVTANTLNIVGTGSFGLGGDSTINGNLAIGNSPFQQGGNVTASLVSANSVTNREQGQSGAVQISQFNYTVGVNNFRINTGTYTANLMGNLVLANNQANFDSAIRSSGVGAGSLDFTVSPAVGGSMPPVWVSIGGSSVSVSNDGNSWWSAGSNGGFVTRPVGFSSQWQSVGRGNTNGNTIAIVAPDAQLWYSNNRANTWYQSNFALSGATKIRGSFTGQFVAVGANGNIMTPTTYANVGDNWTAVVGLGASVTFNDVATNDNGVWVAGGYYTGNGIGVLYRSVDDGNTWTIDTRTNTAWPSGADVGKIAISYDDWNANANTFIVMGGRSRANSSNMEIRTTQWTGSAWVDTIANANASGSPTSTTGWNGVVRWFTGSGFNYYYMTNQDGHAVYVADTLQAPFSIPAPKFSVGGGEVPGNIMRLTSTTGSQFSTVALVTITSGSNTYISQAVGANLTVPGGVTANSLTLPGITLGGNNLSVSGNISAGNNISAGGNLSVSRDAVITGNLTVLGNAIYNDTSSLVIQDPVFELGVGNNDTVLTSPDSADRGMVMHSYGNGFTKVNSAAAPFGNTVIAIANTVGIVPGMFIGTPDLANVFNHLSTIVTVNTNANVVISNALVGTLPINSNLAIGNDLLRFEGWDTSSNEFTFGSNVNYDQATNIITYNQYGNLRFNAAAANLIGNGNTNAQFTGTTANLNAGNSNIVISNNSTITINGNGTNNLFSVTGNVDTFGTARITMGQPQAYLVTESIYDQTYNITDVSFTRGGLGGAGQHVIMFWNTDGSIQLGNGTTDQMFTVDKNDIVRVGSIIDSVDAGARTAAFNVAGGISVVSNGWFGGNLYSNNANITNNLVANNANFAANLAANNANITSNLAANNANIGNNVVIGNTLQVAGNITGNANIIGNFNGNVYAGNSNVRLLANSNVSISANGNSNIILVQGGTTSNVFISGNLQVNANVIANFNGNVYAGNSNVRLLANSNVSVSANGNANILTIEGGTTSNVYVSGNLQVNANIIGNFVGNLYNGNSNVRIAANGNVSVSANGNANILVIEGGTTSNMYVSGNITGNANIIGNFNGNLYAGNSNVSLTANANVTITANNSVVANFVAGGSNGNVTFFPGGTTLVLGSASNVPYIGVNNSGTGAYVKFSANSIVLGNGDSSNYVSVSNAAVLLANAGTDATTADGGSGAIRTLGGISANKSVYVGGNLQATGNVTAKGVANGVQYYNSGNLNSTANLTFDGSNLNYTGANATFANVSNLRIVGATANNQQLRGNTDGTMFFADASSVDKIANGNSNIYADTANGNIHVTIAGNANIVTFYNSGVVIGNASNAIINTTLSDGNITTGGNVIVGNSSNAIINTTLANGNITTGGNILVGTVSGTAASTDKSVGIRSTNTSAALSVSSNTANATLTFKTGNGTAVAGQSLDVGTVTGTTADYTSNARILSTTNATSPIVGAFIVTPNTANANLSVAIGNGNAYVGGNLQIGTAVSSAAVNSSNVRVYSNLNATAANAGGLVVTGNIANTELSVATGNGNVIVGGGVTLGRLTTNVAQTNSNIMVYSNIDVTDTQTGAITVTSNNANANLSTAIGNGKMFTGLGVQVGYTSASQAVGSATMWLYSNLNATNSNASGPFRISANSADANLSIAMGNGNAYIGTSVTVGNATAGGAGVNSANLRVLSNVNATAPATGAFIVAGNTANANLAVAIGNGNAYVGGNIVVGTTSTGLAVNSSNVTVYSNTDSTSTSTGGIIVTSNTSNANLSTAVGNGKINTGLAIQVGTIVANVAQSAGNIILYSNVNATAPNVGAFITSGNIGNGNLTISMGNGNAYIGGNLEVGTNSANLGAAVNSSRLYIYSNINAANLSTTGLGAFTVGGNLSNANLTTTIGNGNVYTGGNLQVGTGLNNDANAAQNATVLKVISNVNATTGVATGGLIVTGNIGNANLSFTTGNGNVFAGGNLQVGTGLNSDANAAQNASKLLVISNINATTSTGGFVVTGNIANANLTTAIGNGNVRTGGNIIVGAGLNSDANAAVSNSNVIIYSNINAANTFSSSGFGGFTVTGNTANANLTTTVGNGNVVTGGAVMIGGDVGNILQISARNSNVGGANPAYALIYSSANAGEIRIGTAGTTPITTFGSLNANGVLQAGSTGLQIRPLAADVRLNVLGASGVANANLRLDALGVGNVNILTGNLNLLGRGTFANQMVNSDQVMSIGASDATNNMNVGLQTANGYYGGYRWMKAAGTEVAFWGLDNTANIGNFILNTVAGQAITIQTGNSSRGDYGVTRVTKGFALYNANSVTITNGTDTLLTAYNVSGTDTTGLSFSNGVWTNNTGRTIQLMVTIQSTWDNNTTGARVHYLSPSASTSQTNRFAMMDVGASPDFSSFSSTAVYQMANGDTFGVVVWQNSGASRTYSGAGAGQSANSSSRVSIVVL